MLKIVCDLGQCRRAGDSKDSGILFVEFFFFLFLIFCGWKVADAWFKFLEFLVCCGSVVGDAMLLEHRDLSEKWWGEVTFVDEVDLSFVSRPEPSM